MSKNKIDLETLTVREVEPIEEPVEPEFNFNSGKIDVVISAIGLMLLLIVLTVWIVKAGAIEIWPISAP